MPYLHAEDKRAFRIRYRPKQRALTAAWRAAHPEKARLYADRAAARDKAKRDAARLVRVAQREAELVATYGSREAATRATKRAWREANRERLREKERARYHANVDHHREVMRQRMKTWRARHAEKVRQRRRELYEANIDHKRELGRNSKRRRDRGRCVVCDGRPRIGSDWSTAIVVEGFTINVNTCSTECTDLARQHYQHQVETARRCFSCQRRQRRSDKSWFEIVDLPLKRFFLATCSPPCLDQAEQQLAKEKEWLKEAKQKQIELQRLLQKLKKQSVSHSYEKESRPVLLILK
jgi:hypothetical protein